MEDRDNFQSNPDAFTAAPPAPGFTRAPILDAPVNQTHNRADHLPEIGTGFS